MKKCKNLEKRKVRSRNKVRQSARSFVKNKVRFAVSHVRNNHA